MQHKTVARELINAVGAGGSATRVRNKNTGCLITADFARQQRKNDGSGLRIEVAGGLVDEHQLRAMGEGAGNSDALYFAA